ncbi:MAG: hypothetical protein ACOCQQ_02205 [Candidatus Nanoarchaeia archaeon]
MINENEIQDDEEFEHEEFEDEEFEDEKRTYDEDYSNDLYAKEMREHDEQISRKRIDKNTLQENKFSHIADDVLLFKQYVASQQFEKDMGLLESSIDAFDKRIHLQYVLEKNLTVPTDNLSKDDVLALRRCENALQTNIDFVADHINNSIDELHNKINKQINLEEKIKAFDELSTINGMAQNFGLETFERKKSLDNLFQTYKDSFPDNDLSLIDNYVDAQDNIHLMTYTHASNKILNKYSSWFSKKFFNKNKEGKIKKIIVNEKNSSSFDKNKAEEKEYANNVKNTHKPTKIIKKTSFFSKLFWMGIGAGIATMASTHTINKYQTITENAVEHQQELVQQNNKYNQIIEENVLVPKEQIKNEAAIVYKKQNEYVYEPFE